MSRIRGDGHYKEMSPVSVGVARLNTLTLYWPKILAKKATIINLLKRFITAIVVTLNYPVNWKQTNYTCVCPDHFKDGEEETSKDYLAERSIFILLRKRDYMYV